MADSVRAVRRSSTVALVAVISLLLLTGATLQAVAESPTPSDSPMSAEDTSIQVQLPTQASKLWVEKSKATNNNILHWVGAPDATEYRVYATNNMAVWNYGSPLATVVTTTYVHAGAYADGKSWYYTIRSANASGENTTQSNEFGNIAYEVEVFMDYDATRANQIWISLPWRTVALSTAQKLALDLNDQNAVYPNCKWVGHWNIATQSVDWYIRNNLAWTWTVPWVPQPGEGYCIILRVDFTWHCNGTDWGTGPVAFNHDSSRGNMAYFSPKYTACFNDANALQLSLNGGNASSPATCAIMKWNTASQTCLPYLKPRSVWLGNNFQFSPGGGYACVMKTDFSWMGE